jgi:hypothetical protein
MTNPATDTDVAHRRRRHRQAGGRPQCHSLARRPLGARRLLRRPAEPLDGRLFLAGEATSTESYTTAHGAHGAHGAHLTGIDTAHKVARALGKS